MNEEEFRTAIGEIVDELYMAETMGQCAFNGEMYQNEFVPKWNDVKDQLDEAKRRLAKLRAKSLKQAEKKAQEMLDDGELVDEDREYTFQEIDGITEEPNE